jgi:phage repressor protein C with HTH and peptisase S24 domain
MNINVENVLPCRDNQGMALQSQLPPAEQLRIIRQRCGLSMAEMAKLLDFKGSSSYQRYEDPTIYPDVLPLKFAQKLLASVLGKGEPPLSRSDIMALAGLTADDAQGFSLNHSDASSVGELSSPTQMPAPALPGSAQTFEMLPLFDIRVSAGPGALVEHDGQPTGYLPFDAAWLRSISQAPVNKLALLRVSGDSMWDTLHDGDQILVDLSARRPSQDAIYVLRHDDALLVKRLQVRFDVQKIEVISDNPKYKAYLASPDDIRVVGRVVWMGRQV